ncbi:hypothetical protein ABW20_dc0100182 [Dactylellina cionopaga]|nr:hypothetical protein ABW20_dc0100182 [Dactylellina cionopaga]
MATPVIIVSSRVQWVSITEPTVFGSQVDSSYSKCGANGYCEILDYTKVDICGKWLEYRNWCCRASVYIETDQGPAYAQYIDQPCHNIPQLRGKTVKDFGSPIENSVANECTDTDGRFLGITPLKDKQGFPTLVGDSYCYKFTITELDLDLLEGYSQSPDKPDRAGTIRSSATSSSPTIVAPTIPPTTSIGASGGSSGGGNGDSDPSVTSSPEPPSETTAGAITPTSTGEPTSASTGTGTTQQTPNSASRTSGSLRVASLIAGSMALLMFIGVQV